MEYKLKWIDVLKGLLVIAVYIGCIGGGEEITHSFISTHYAALFFCVFGLVENFDKEKNVFKYILNKIKKILVPCFVLAYLVLIIVTIQYDGRIDFVKGINELIVKGLVRNSFVAASLWCFTCLFSMQLMFFVVKKIKYRWLMFVICLSLHCYNVLRMNSLEFPQWYFNVDSALYYMLFYAIGYLGYPYVERLFQLDTEKKKVFFTMTGVVALLYSGGLYFNLDILSYILPAFAWRFASALRACIIIWLYFVLARLLEEVKCLANVGENVLYLCAGEYIIRLIIGTAMSILGISFVAEYPIHIFMYVSIAIWLGNKYFVPIEKYLIDKITREV